MAKGKRYSDAAQRFDRDHQHGPEEALDLVKRLATANFDETVELAIQLGVDPRKAEEMVRGTVGLPRWHRQGRASGRLRPGRSRCRGP